MAGNELIDGSVKLIIYIIDIFLAIINFLFKPILNNPSNFGNEPSAYLGYLAVGIFLIILYLIVIVMIYYGVWWLLSKVLDDESIFKQSICLSLTIEIIGLFIMPNNFTIIRILGDIIGLSVIIYVILYIFIFIAEKI